MNNLPKDKFALRDKFYEIIKEWPLANRAVHRLLEEGNLLMFGGSVRNFFENGYSSIPRDFDIVVCTGNEALDDYFIDIPYKRNRYGGYKIDEYEAAFDIWSLHSTWAFKNRKVAEANVENLTKTVFLNYDSVVYDLSTGEFYDEHYRKAVENKVLDIVLQDNPYPDLNVLRTMIFRAKRNMKYSEKLYSYLFEWKTNNSRQALDLLVDMQRNHYGFEYLSAEELLHELEYLS